MALTPSALVMSARSSTMSRISVWRTGISKALAAPIRVAMSEIGGDAGDADGDHDREQRRARRQHQIDADQQLEPRQPVGREPADGAEHQVGDVEQEAGEAEQEDGARQAVDEPGQRDLLDPGADHGDDMARRVEAEARLGQRRGQPQVPVGLGHGVPPRAGRGGGEARAGPGRRQAAWSEVERNGGRDRDRTCDPSRVKGVRYRCATRPTGATPRVV